MATLIFLEDDKGEKAYDLKPEGTSIGRETDNDIILQEGEISRHHARIVEKDGEWVFKDLGSGLGTTVNDEPVKDSEQVLIPGDLIVMGRHKFKFEPGVSDVTIIGGLQAPTAEDIEKAKSEPAEENTPETPEEPEPEVTEEAPEPVEEKEEETTPEEVPPAEEAEETEEEKADEPLSLAEEMSKKEEPEETPETSEEKPENPEEELETITFGAPSAAESEEKAEPEASEEEEEPKPVLEKAEEEEKPAEEPEEPKASPYDKENEAEEKSEEPEPVEDEPAQEETAEPASEETTPAPAKKGGGKALFGCGGCGCLLTLILLPAGIFMMAMAGDSHMSELGPFGFILTPIAGFIGFVSLVLLIIGMVMKKKQNKA